MDRENKRVKALAEYHNATKKKKVDPNVASGGAAAADQDPAAQDDNDEALIQDFSMKPSKKSKFVVYLLEYPLIVSYFIFLSEKAKMPARFARMQQKMEQDKAEEEKKELEVKSSVEVEPIDLSQRLPEAIYSLLTAMTQKLELGEISEATNMLN